jgi:excisionase family DNA binding protein
MGAEITQIPPLLLNASQVASALSVSLRTVRRLQADGTLPPVRLGGAVRWPADQVTAFVDKLKAERDRA